VIVSSLSSSSSSFSFLVLSTVGVDKERLSSIITSRILDMSSGGASRRGSSYRIPLDSTQAMYARDAVAKSIYKVLPSQSLSLSSRWLGPFHCLQMVFDWIVHRIRRSLEPEGVDSSALPHIGVLDIFGFESFAENGLEQLLINYGLVSFPPSLPSFLLSDVE
jgi:myosin heavy subunit